MNPSWYVSNSRIIPAYAGSTCVRGRVAGLSRDHPRIRGEHALSFDLGHAHAGSSPHTRGAPTRSSGSDIRCRIIPAYAGSTGTPSPGFSGRADHPRIRGEHSVWPDMAWPKTGSSPHTRGARQAILPVSSLARIIPAYAGSTSRHSWPTLPNADHPRIRGEHSTS